MSLKNSKENKGQFLFPAGRRRERWQRKAAGKSGENGGREWRRERRRRENEKENDQNGKIIQEKAGDILKQHIIIIFLTVENGTAIAATGASVVLSDATGLRPVLSRYRRVCRVC